MSGRIDNILVVGGGTAGWFTAAYLAKTLRASESDGVQVTLIESSDIGVIGVGEGTFPTIKAALQALEIDEARFLQACSAAFKQGIRFVDWERAPQGGRHGQYLHPFASPKAMEGGGDLLPYWLAGLAGDRSYADAVTLQEKVCEAGRGPKRPTDAPFGGPMNYAYHFDAGRMATLLKEVGKGFGVRHMIGDVEGVELGESGAIARVRTRQHGALKADFYVDATGFRAELIEGALKSPFLDVSDVLFVDRAVAMQIPYNRPDTPIATTTISTAHEAGWTWDIGLQERRGTGYVYSSRHTSDDRAEAVLRAYNGPAAEGLHARLLKLRIGYRERPWIANCAAVGLAGGFLEPLESTGIILIEVAAYMLADLLPRSGGLEAAARQFNRNMADRYARAVDFLKLHYGLSRRTEPFWRDNADPVSWTDQLRDHIEIWAHRPPTITDFPSRNDSFQYCSYQYVLYGMGFRTRAPAGLPAPEAARHEYRRIAVAGAKAVESLPDHRALIKTLMSGR